MKPAYKLYVGIDWASQLHEVCVLDGAGEVLARRTIAHRAEGIAELQQWVCELADGQVSEVAVAIEVPRGALVEALEEMGAHVYHVNPKQLDRMRDRYSSSGAKDDRRDALVLADSLRLNERFFRRVHIDDPRIVELREIGRLEAQLTEERTRLSSRLRELLNRFWPALLALSDGDNDCWLWSLLELAPTPEKARRLRLPQLADLLCKHRIRRFDSVKLHATLQQPPLPVSAGTIEAASLHLRLVVEQLRLVERHKRECCRRLDAILEKLCPQTDEEGKPPKHRDVEILCSMPGVGRFVAAAVLGEAGQLIANRDYYQLRSQAGIAPVTRRSGKSTRVSMRRACNHRLRNALHHWSQCSLSLDPRSRALYDRLRQRGHGNARALRSLADRHLRVLMAMLRDQRVYDPQRATPVTAADGA